MASAQASNKLFSNMKITQYDHDAGDTAANDVAWVDLRDYENFGVTIFTSLLGGNGPTAFTILANDESDGGGTDVEIKAHAVGDAPDAVGDYLVLECTAEEIAQLGAAAGVELRYVSASVTNHHNDDEEVVTYIRAGARFAQDGLTADVVA